MDVEASGLQGDKKGTSCEDPTLIAQQELSKKKETNYKEPTLIAHKELSDERRVIHKIATMIVQPELSNERIISHEEPTMIVQPELSNERTISHEEPTMIVQPQLSNERTISHKEPTMIVQPELSNERIISHEEPTMIVQPELSNERTISHKEPTMIVQPELSDSPIQSASNADIFSTVESEQLSDNVIQSASNADIFPAVQSKLSESTIESSVADIIPAVQSKLSESTIESSVADIIPAVQSQQFSDNDIRSASNADIFPAVSEEHYILAVNIDTCIIKGQVYDRSAHIKGTASRQQQLLQPEPGWCEIDPHKLVQDVCLVAKESIVAAGLQPDQITCMGLTTLRSSFLTWDRETGEPFHNIITWQDLRAINYVYKWNKSFRLLLLNAVAKLLYKVFEKKRYLVASVLKFMSKQVTLKLLWVLDNVPAVRARASEHQVMFGCIESWLLWNMTLVKSHVTDFSCASTTGLFDPFQLEWSSIVCSLVNIPMSMFPKVKDTSGDFGVTDPDICGFRIPITAVVCDQQGSMFGHCCFNPGDMKCTLDTGTFLDYNTGNRPYTSISELYSIIGWKIDKELVYLAEGQSADTWIIVEWARSLGLFSDIVESSDVAESVPDSGGVFFVPSFTGLQVPYNDDKAATAIFGMTPTTTRAHLVRALLESVAFKFKSLYEEAVAGTKISLSHIKVDGGVAANNFLIQMMSDVFDQDITRSLHTDMSSLGTAFLAGLARGVWSSKEELKLLYQSDKQFVPSPTWRKVKILYQHWENAVHRSQSWYCTP